MFIEPISYAPLKAPADTSTSVAPQNDDMMKAAKEFEAAFLSQMLTFSGLGDALVSDDSQKASAFTSFFIDALAEDMTEAGGIGLAESIYKSLESKQAES